MEYRRLSLGTAPRLSRSCTDLTTVPRYRDNSLTSRPQLTRSQLSVMTLSTDNDRNRKSNKPVTVPNAPYLETDRRALRPRVRDVLGRYRASQAKLETLDTVDNENRLSKRLQKNDNGQMKSTTTSEQIPKAHRVNRKLESQRGNITNRTMPKSDKVYCPKCEEYSGLEVDNSTYICCHTHMEPEDSPEIGEVKIVQLADVSPETLADLTANSKRLPLLKWWLSEENINSAPELNNNKPDPNVLKNDSDVYKRPMFSHNTSNLNFNSMQRSSSLNNIYSHNTDLSTDRSTNGVINHCLKEYGPGLGRHIHRKPIPGASLTFNEVVTKMEERKDVPYVQLDKCPKHMQISDDSEDLQDDVISFTSGSSLDGRGNRILFGRNSSAVSGRDNPTPDAASFGKSNNRSNSLPRIETGRVNNKRPLSSQSLPSIDNKQPERNTARTRKGPPRSASSTFLRNCVASSLATQSAPNSRPNSARGNRTPSNNDTTLKNYQTPSKSNGSTSINNLTPSKSNQAPSNNYHSPDIKRTPLKTNSTIKKKKVPTATLR